MRTVGHGKWKTGIPLNEEAADALLEEAETFENPNNVFGNPDSHGYGGGAWPFDMARALYNDGYRAGVYNAMQQDWTASNWRAATQRLLDHVWFMRRVAARFHNTTGLYRGYTYQESLYLVWGHIVLE